jgi:four helix bundle protein
VRRFGTVASIAVPHIQGMIAYEKFTAWKAAHQLALEIYAVSDEWPVSERYQLTTQVRRAALSVPTNIAEGAAKRGRREFRRYLDIASGSLAELTYLLHFTKDRGLIAQDMFERLYGLKEYASKLTWKLYLSLAPNSRYPTA